VELGLLDDAPGTLVSAMEENGKGNFAQARDLCDAVLVMDDASEIQKATAHFVAAVCSIRLRDVVEAEVHLAAFDALRSSLPSDHQALAEEAFARRGLRELKGSRWDPRQRGCARSGSGGGHRMASGAGTDAMDSSTNMQIRLAMPGDAEGVREIYVPYVRSSAVTFETVEPSVEEMAQRIAGISARYPWLVCEISDAVAGYAYASRHRERAAYQWCVEVSVYVDGAHHGRGIGSALYDALFRILMDQGFYTAYAGITLPNPASISLHEKKGFKAIGVFGNAGYKLNAWHDVGWWQRSLREKDAAPDTPMDFPTWVKLKGTRALPEYGVTCPDASTSPAHGRKRPREAR
jgi:L-amino acid N-acyltransferase YncA